MGNVITCMPMSSSQSAISHAQEAVQAYKPGELVYPYRQPVQKVDMYMHQQLQTLADLIAMSYRLGENRSGILPSATLFDKELRFDQKLSTKHVAVYHSRDPTERKPLLVLAYRGTRWNHKKDIWADIDFIICHHRKDTRFLAAERSFVKITKRFPDHEVVITGHSLGAALVNHINADHCGRIRLCVGFDSPAMVTHKSQLSKWVDLHNTVLVSNPFDLIGNSLLATRSANIVCPAPDRFLENPQHSINQYVSKNVIEIFRKDSEPTCGVPMGMYEPRPEDFWVERFDALFGGDAVRKSCIRKRSSRVPNPSHLRTRPLSKLAEGTEPPETPIQGQHSRTATLSSGPTEPPETPKKKKSGSWVADTPKQPFSRVVFRSSKTSLSAKPTEPRESERRPSASKKTHSRTSSWVIDSPEDPMSPSDPSSPEVRYSKQGKSFNEWGKSDANAKAIAGLWLISPKQQEEEQQSPMGQITASISSEASLETAL